MYEERESFKMDENTRQMITDMGVSLTTLAVKGTASAVNKKIRSIKDVRDAEKLRVTYDELINEVLQEREEAVRIAQVYKSELDRIEISDEDIEHLHNTISSLIEIIKSIQMNKVNENSVDDQNRVKAQANDFEKIKELISVDTLKTMQLLGFNYKVAIGEPLTQLCADAITRWGTSNKRKR